MTHKLVPFIGARFIHAEQGLYLAAVGKDEHPATFTYIDINSDSISAVEGEARLSVVGMLIATADLESLDFQAVLPVEPVIGDIVALPRSFNGSKSFVVGVLQDLQEQTAIINEDGGTLAVPIADIVVVDAVGSRAHAPLLETGDAVVFLVDGQPLAKGQAAYVLNPNATHHGLPGVTVQSDDFRTFFVSRQWLAPAVRWNIVVDYLGDVATPSVDIPGADNKLTAATAISEILNSVNMKALFGPDFVSMNSLGANSGPLGDCFSIEEAEILRLLTELEPDSACNLLGLTILGGRQIEETTLREILSDEIPYGLAVLIPNARDFFSEIGRIVTAQNDEKTRRILEWISLGEPSDRLPDLDMESPADIAFTRITGTDPVKGPPQDDIGNTYDTTIINGEGTQDDAQYVANFAEKRFYSGEPSGVVDDPRLIELAKRNGYTPDAGPLMYQVVDEGDEFNVKLFVDTDSSKFMEGAKRLLDAILAGESQEPTIAGVPDEDDSDLLDVIQAIFGDDAKIVDIDKEGNVTIEGGAAPEDLAAQAAVEGGAQTPVGAYLDLVDETLPEIALVGKIGKGDTALLANNILTHGQAITRYLDNIADLFVEGASAVDPQEWADLRDPFLTKLKASTLAALDETFEIAKLIEPIKGLHAGFDAVETDASNLLALKP